MKAAVCTTLEGPDGVSIMDFERPKPASDQVLVRVRAAGLNFMDTLITRGKYQLKPALPFSPSAEIAGEIAEIGDAVTDFSVGQRVCGYCSYGGAAEYISVDPRQLAGMPDGVSFEQAAGLTVTYGTAIHSLNDRGRLREGETVAVLGASGGAGMAAVEISKRLGARVIAVASSESKLEICKAAGADLTINYAQEDLKQQLRDLTDGNGVDVIYDCVGGAHAEPALRSMAWEGRYLVVGFASGEIPRIPLNLALLKGCDIVGVFWGASVERDPSAHRRNLERVLGWVDDGSLEPRVHTTLKLDQAAEGIRMLDRREARGKIILTM